MTSPLFKRLALLVVFIIVLTLAAVWFTPATSRLVLLVIVGVGFAIIAAIAIGVVRSLAARVARLRSAVQNLPGGDAADRAPAPSGDDLSSLENSLAGVAGELRSLLSRLNFETARRDAILAGMAEGVLAIDPDLRVTFCNAALLRDIGFRGANYEGLPVLGLVRDSTFYDFLQGVVRTGEANQLRFHFSGSARVFHVHATPLAMPNGRGALAISRDITELERLEQVRKDFVANVSHELRTPLAGVIGYADTLLDGALHDSNNNRKFLEIIRGNAVRLSNITADLLVLSELESGAEPSEGELISVRGVLDGAMVTMQTEADLRGVKLIRDHIDTVQVVGSRLRLEQALLNLLANAIKFNKPGGEVHVRAAEANGKVEIQVADTGVGIPSEDLPRIFERFYRVDKARSRQVGGTGLGLSIVRHVVERMNGVVTVESQLGRGSVFTLSLPSVNGHRAES